MKLSLCGVPALVTAKGNEGSLKKKKKKITLKSGALTESKETYKQKVCEN